MILITGTILLKMPSLIKIFYTFPQTAREVHLVVLHDRNSLINVSCPDSKKINK